MFLGRNKMCFCGPFVKNTVVEIEWKLQNWNEQLIVEFEMKLFVRTVIS